jgi:hypothetical protein
LIEAKQIAQRFKILKFSAQFALAAQPLDRVEQHLIEKFLEQSPDSRAIRFRQVREIAEARGKKRFALGLKPHPQPREHGAGVHARLPA